MKILKKIFELFLTYIFILILSLTAEAGDLNIAAKTGDEIIGVIIAFAAFVITAFITMRLTRRKNKLDKK